MLKKEDKDGIIEYLRIQMETILNKATEKDVRYWLCDETSLESALDFIRDIADKSLMYTSF